jgi:hypothetical protein
MTVKLPDVSVIAVVTSVEHVASPWLQMFTVASATGLCEIVSTSVAVKGAIASVVVGNVTWPRHAQSVEPPPAPLELELELDVEVEVELELVVDVAFTLLPPHAATAMASTTGR